MMNVVEVILYGLYILIVLNHGVPSAKGKGVQVSEGVSSWLSGGRRVAGKRGNRALMLGFSASLLTLSKTILYSRFIAIRYSGIVSADAWSQ